MTLGEFRKYLSDGKITLDRTKVANVIIELRTYISENVKPGNFAAKNPLDLKGEILNIQIVYVKAYNNQSCCPTITIYK